MGEKQYKLVWKENFNEAEINASVWQYEVGYVRNHELQYYTDARENAYIEDSCLVIEAVRTGCPTRPYTSASLNTHGKRSFLYGKLEMRAKLLYGTGIWPAFWTLGDRFPEEQWPQCGEIDIMEMIGGRGSDKDGLGGSEIFGTIHYPGESAEASDDPEKKTARGFLPVSQFANGFHIISVEWTPAEIKWFLDGTCYKKVSIVGMEPFHKPHYLLVNLAVGGDWPGEPDENTVFPQKYCIDWIRYYQIMNER